MFAAIFVVTSMWMHIVDAMAEQLLSSEQHQALMAVLDAGGALSLGSRPTFFFFFFFKDSQLGCTPTGCPELKCPRFLLNETCPIDSFVECNDNGEVRSLCVVNPQLRAKLSPDRTRRKLASRRLKNGAISTMIGKLTALEYMWVGPGKEKKLHFSDTFLSPSKSYKTTIFLQRYKRQRDLWNDPNSNWTSDQPHEYVSLARSVRLKNPPYEFVL
jgi:hypothetical protein